MFMVCFLIHFTFFTDSLIADVGLRTEGNIGMLALVRFLQKITKKSFVHFVMFVKRIWLEDAQVSVSNVAVTLKILITHHLLVLLEWDGTYYGVGMSSSNVMCFPSSVEFAAVVSSLNGA